MGEFDRIVKKNKKSTFKRLTAFCAYGIICILSITRCAPHCAKGAKMTNLNEHKGLIKGILGELLCINHKEDIEYYENLYYERKNSNE